MSTHPVHICLFWHNAEIFLWALTNLSLYTKWVSDFMCHLCNMKNKDNQLPYYIIKRGQVFRLCMPEHISLYKCVFTTAVCKCVYVCVCTVFMCVFFCLDQSAIVRQVTMRRRSPQRPHHPHTQSRWRGTPCLLTDNLTVDHRSVESRVVLF